MFLSHFFNFRYLVALILLVVLVAAVGNAAALNYSDMDQNAVQGATNPYFDVTGTVTYTINGTGDVIANVDFGTDSFDAVSASFNNGTSYTACAGGPSVWQCTLANGDVAAAASIDLVAVQN